MQQTQKLNAAQTTSMMSEVRDLEEQVEAAGDLDVALSSDRKGLSAHN